MISEAKIPNGVHLVDDEDEFPVPVKRKREVRVSAEMARFIRGLEYGKCFLVLDLKTAAAVVAWMRYHGYDARQVRESDSGVYIWKCQRT